MRLHLLRVLLASLILGLLAFPSSSSAFATSYTLDDCVAAINDPAITKATIASDMGYAGNVSGLATFIAGRIYVASGPGEIPGSASSDGNNVDLFCGDSNDNTIQTMDSNASTYDYFYGGAGNDSVTVHMWKSKFFGGPGNDYVAYLDEASFFYGGPGTDSVGTIGGGSTFDQGIDIDPTPPVFNGFALPGNATTATYRTSVSLSATVSLAGVVTFFMGGKRIPGCINIPTSAVSPFIAQCPWKPAVIGTMALTATTKATSNGQTASTTSPLRIAVSTRSNKR